MCLILFSKDSCRLGWRWGKTRFIKHGGFLPCSVGDSARQAGRQTEMEWTRRASGGGENRVLDSNPKPASAGLAQAVLLQERRALRLCRLAGWVVGGRTCHVQRRPRCLPPRHSVFASQLPGRSLTQSRSQAPSCCCKTAAQQARSSQCGHKQVTHVATAAKP